MSFRSRVTPLRDPIQPSPPATADALALPLRNTELQAVLAGIYRQAVAGVSVGEALGMLCRELARLLNLRLAVAVERLDTGAFTLAGTSRETPLWIELHRVPERWDSGVASQGPAATALRHGNVVRMGVEAEGFALWRNTAKAEQVREILALPVKAPRATYVLELFFDAPIAEGASTGTMTASGLALAIAGLLSDLAEIEARTLLARALECAGTGAFITDLSGTIVWSNESFATLSGYTPDDARGRNASVLRSGEQGTRYYRELWSTIRAGRSWSGETVDRAKDGRPYIIQQTISPVSQNGRVTNYVSVHHEIGREKRLQTRLELASRLEPETGLLTRAAFDAAASRALADMKAPRPEWALVLVSARGLQRRAPELDGETEDLVSALLARRLRECLGPDELAGLYGSFEYALLLRGAPMTDGVLAERLNDLAQRLGEPIGYLREALDLDVHFGSAHFPRDAATLRELMAKADRKLADEPYRQARRSRD